MNRSTCTLKLIKISRFNMVTKKLMNLSFFTKIFGRSVQLSSSFGKTFSYVGTLVSTKTKCIKLICIGKNNTCTSCVFNGFKYTNKITDVRELTCTTFHFILLYMMEKICLFSYGRGEINKQSHSWNSKANGRFQLRGHFWQ